MIELVNVCAGYGKETILHNISCQFHTAGITAIVGPNGSGKSTLIKTILGIIPKSQGEIKISGMDSTTMDRKELAREIGYLPQVRELPAITAQRMILHGRFPHLSYPRVYSKADLKLVDDAMKQMGIESLRYKDVSKMSGGERQKVYLAMALVQNAKTIILDEPTTYLDIAYQMELMNLLDNLKKEGKTIVVVLHDLNLALQYADTIVVMEKGMIQGIGTPNQIYNDKILETVFQVQCKKLKDEEENEYYFFYKS